MLKRILILVLICFSISSCSSTSTSPKQSISPKIGKEVMLENEAFDGLDRKSAEDKIKTFIEKTEIKKIDAVVNPETWVVEQKEIIGKKINIEKTLEKLFSANASDKLSLVIEDDVPKILSEEYQKNIIQLSVFSTPLLNKQASRINNISIASNVLDFYKLPNEDTFSFNGTTGRRTKEKGYVEAPIIVKTKDGYDDGYGVGGGICQVATTVFNAAKNANLVIVERHEHSKDVGYVPDGMDATVSYDGVDLKFRNTSGFPIMLRTYLDKNNLTVKILQNKNIF